MTKPNPKLSLIVFLLALNILVLCPQNVWAWVSISIEKAILPADGKSKTKVDVYAWDEEGKPSSIAITFSLNPQIGSVKPNPITTGSDGRGSTRYIAGTVPGYIFITAASSKGSDSASIALVKGEIENVSGADYIGDISSQEKVFATNVSDETALFNLKVTPSGVELPEGFITWSGGTQGTDQFHRRVSRSKLKENGVLLTAYMLQSPTAKARVYVFEAEPVASDVKISYKIKKDKSILSAGEFGKMEAYAWDPDITIRSYYKDKNWKFVFEKISHQIKWEIQSLQRTNVTSGDMKPFPNGYLMPKNSTQFERKTKAKEDLKPNPKNLYEKPTRDYYWTSVLTTKHEQFHISDWTNGYYAPGMEEAESAIENMEVPITLGNLDPNKAIKDKAKDFSTEIINKTDDASLKYDAKVQAEARAYSDGKSAYQSLSDSIKP